MRHVRVLMAVAGVAAVTAGCSAGSTDSSSSPFDDQGGSAVTCMAHQSAAPQSIDRPGKGEDPESVLAYLNYFTRNGNRPYCDGRPATSVDRQWLSLYVAGGASRERVRQALGG